MGIRVGISAELKWGPTGSAFQHQSDDHRTPTAADQTPRTRALEGKALEKQSLRVSTREEEKRPSLCIQPWAHAARLSNLEEKKVFWEGLWDQFLEKH